MILDKTILTKIPSKREKTYFGIFILLFFMMFVRACWLPQRSAIHLLHDTISTLKSQQETLSHLTTQPLMTSSSTSGGELNERVKKADVIDLKDNAFIIDALTDPKGMNGLELTKTTFEAIRSVDQFNVRKTSLEVIGSFSSLRRYVDYLEDLPFLFTIDKLTINSGGESRDRLIATIEGSVYALSR